MEGNENKTEKINEFQQKCHDFPELEKVWNNLVSIALELYPYEVRRGIVLQNNKEPNPAEEEVLVAMRDEYEKTYQVLVEKSNEQQIEVPNMDCIDICQFIRS